MSYTSKLVPRHISRSLKYSSLFEQALGSTSNPDCSLLVSFDRPWEAHNLYTAVVRARKNNPRYRGLRVSKRGPHVYLWNEEDVDAPTSS